MSRIAGLVLSAINPLGRDLAAGMLLKVGDKGWEERHANLGPAYLVWCGWRGPQLSEAQDILVALDGFIYNRKELGDSERDADLFVTLYKAYGFEETLRRINGDFAVALFDQPKRELWLGRDRFGVKPLYYAATRDFFAFASRPRPLLTLPGVTKEINRQYAALFAASHYRFFDNNPEKSPYADVSQLPAAHLLKYAQGRVSVSSYWALSDKADFIDPEKELAERYSELLFDAVTIRFESSTLPAFTLSGGMDSSSVLATAVRVSKTKQHAFSTVYADKTYDESDEIKTMVDSKVEQWHRVEVAYPDIFSLLKEMIEAHDEPVATATWLSHYLLCQKVKEAGFGGLFGGLGGDELNAGEYEYFLYHFADLRTAGADDLLGREIEKWIAYHDHPIFHKNAGVVERGFEQLVDLREPGKCLPDRNRISRYRKALNPDFFELGSFEPVMDHPFASYLKNRTYQDIFRETAPCCLRAEDRQTTAFGLEHFLPFFDHRLAEFMFRVPGTLKIRDGVTKHLLRRAMKRILPEETRTRIKKTGWNAPAHIWFSGKGREQLRDMLSSRSFRERGIYNINEVERLIDEHEKIVNSEEPEENHMMFLWQLVNLELWFRMLEEHKARN